MKMSQVSFTKMSQVSFTKNMTKTFDLSYFLFKVVEKYLLQKSKY